MLGHKLPCSINTAVSLLVPVSAALSMVCSLLASLCCCACAAWGHSSEAHLQQKDVGVQTLQFTDSRLSNCSCHTLWNKSCILKLLRHHNSCFCQIICS